MLSADSSCSSAQASCTSNKSSCLCQRQGAGIGSLDESRCSWGKTGVPVLLPLLPQGSPAVWAVASWRS